MIKKRVECVHGQCVDSVSTNERIHIQCIRVGGVFTAGARPEGALQPCADLGKPLPVVPGEDLGKFSVGELRVGDSCVALELHVAGVVKELVDGRVHPADEKRRD